MSSLVRTMAWRDKSWPTLQELNYSFATILCHLYITLRPRQNGRHFADDSFKCIFLNENFRIWNKISLKFVLKGPINHIPAVVQIMAWRRPRDKPLSELMMVRTLTHICVTRPQWDIWMLSPVPHIMDDRNGWTQTQITLFTHKEHAIM